jgi:hypothetical protein
MKNIIYKIKNKRNLQKILINQEYYIADLQYLKKIYNESGDKLEYYKQKWEHKSFDIVPIFYIFPACSYIIIKEYKDDISQLCKDISKETVQLENEFSNVFDAYLKYCEDNRLSPESSSSFLELN